MSLVARNLVLAEASGRTVLGPLDLDLADGTAATLLGPSGSGKTLLLRALAGALPEGLRVASGGVEAPWDSVEARARHLGWVPQDPWTALHPGLSVGELLDLPPGATPARRDQLLARLRLPGDRAFLRRLPRALSGGQRQRLALGLALLPRPTFLLLDEPASALDPALRLDLVDLLSHLRREEGLGWLWSTHEVALARRLGGTTLALSEGRLVWSGPAANLDRVEAPEAFAAQVALGLRRAALSP